MRRSAANKLVRPINDAGFDLQRSLASSGMLSGNGNSPDDKRRLKINGFVIRAEEATSRSKMATGPLGWPNQCPEARAFEFTDYVQQ